MTHHYLANRTGFIGLRLMFAIGIAVACFAVFKHFGDKLSSLKSSGMSFKTPMLNQPRASGVEFRNIPLNKQGAHYYPEAQGVK